MKSKNRIQQDDHSQPIKNQPKTTIAPHRRRQEPGIGRGGGPYSGKTPIALTIFDEESDKMLAGTDITAEQFKILKARAKASGSTIGYMLAKAVARMTQPEYPKDDPDDNLLTRHRRHKWPTMTVTFWEPGIGHEAGPECGMKMQLEIPTKSFQRLVKPLLKAARGVSS